MQIQIATFAKWIPSVSDSLASGFEQQLRECHRLVYHVAYSVLRDRADAEEVVQDVFFRAYRKHSDLREPQKFRSWVARMSFRLALNQHRTNARAQRRDTSWLEMNRPAPQNVETVVAQREFHSRLQREIDSLPDKLRVVLLLSAVEELSAREVADLLGIPEGTVRSRLFLARKELGKVFCHEAL